MELDIAPRYFVRIKDHSGTTVAYFDNPLSLSYSKIIGQVYSYSFSIPDYDVNINNFRVDYQVEIYRSIQGVGLDFYLDFEGFHRKLERNMAEDGTKVLTSSGVGYNDLLARTVIGFNGGTIRADKGQFGETAMKQFVEENCGPTATGPGTSVGRFYNGVLPGFTVDTDLSQGGIWTGSVPYENLLDVLNGIRNTTGIDFAVVGNGKAQFLFKTYYPQMGSNRSNLDIDSATGLNIYGNIPVIFSINHENVSSITYTRDHTQEINVIYMLGQGDLSTRDVYVYSNPAGAAMSPWNRTEVSRPATTQEYEYQIGEAGHSILEENRYKETFTFQPMKTTSCLYGVHYFLGDIVTVRHVDVEKNLHIIGIKVGFNESVETIELTTE